MSEERHELSIKRILVAVDASPHSLAALGAAVDLAARFQAELIGIFVEEENLLRLARLPFVQEVGLFSATRRHIDGEELERQLRAQGQRARRIFTVTTQQAQITWSFRVVRGTVLSEVLAAAMEADVLVLGKAGWSLLRHRQLGSTVRGMLPQQFGLALVLKEGARLSDPLAIVYDGSPAGERALIAADTLRQQPNSRQPLIVLLLAEEPQAAQMLKVQATSLLAERGSLVRYRSMAGTNLVRLANILLAENCGTVVLPARSPIIHHGVLVNLLEHLDLPVLLVT